MAGPIKPDEAKTAALLLNPGGNARVTEACTLANKLTMSPKSQKREEVILKVKENPGKQLSIDGKNQEPGWEGEGWRSNERDPCDQGRSGHLPQKIVCTGWLHAKGQARARQDNESKKTLLSPEDVPESVS